ncbi:uncharacterized protein LOC105778931 [Gossypium raimondii]|uniref:uncharacterized protein LOC105778931 n=1 Tax=Gossypium raimondii TaxID=29730 RepID=UPI00063ACE43|nr:uncharacterized protein LOC105778931 [Gossypium raimondii]
MDLLADHVGQPTASWKENLVGSSSNIGGEDLKVKEDFEVLEGDIQKSIINGIQCTIIQDMKKTVILKLLGCNIGFSILQNRIYSLWKPSLTVHLMDIENGFFLAKFVNKIDYEKVLLEGYMYKCKILVEIGGLVGKVTKLDMNTNNKERGRFARMDVYVTLDRPLVSQVLINGKIQRAEYEFLLKVVVSMIVEETSENGGSYGPWMHVKERSQ